MNKKEFLSWKKQAIKLQKKDCCKYWIKMWFEKIGKAIRDTDGGCFDYCPECSKKFKDLDI